jgi:hypothetical protein
MALTFVIDVLRLLHIEAREFSQQDSCCGQLLDIDMTLIKH